jgi:tetratricopeptide (TPR) repeat protein
VLSESEVAALLAALRDHLGNRRIDEGIRLLELRRDELEACSPASPHSGVLLGLAAQWVDAGFASPQLIERLTGRFTKSTRSALPLLDYLHLRMAEGAIAMSNEDFEGAASHFRFVQSLGGEVDDAELLAIANFWTGRCLRKMGLYDDALEYIARGEHLALLCGYTQMAAIMQATRSWLAFQKGRLSEATDILSRAEEALSQTDDFLSRGNVQSAYGRIARRQGHNQRALEYFERAICEYRHSSGAQLQLARTLSNLAFVNRLLALERQKQLDRDAATRRSAREDTGHAADGVRELRAEIDRIRGEARAHLVESMAIYTAHHNHHGLAGALINNGFLHLDSGDLDQAAADAAEAYQHGHLKTDYITMARARMLQCIIEHTALEEQVGDPARHREAATTYARDAVRYAGQTQNRRLLARTYVWQGLALAAEPDRDAEAARHCYEQAVALLQTGVAEREYAWDELEALKAAVLRARRVDPTLRAWSAGVVGDKSFQQLTEEFARIVIPKVWEREGGKVSRVAERLSMSPKKVRRILDSVGLLERGKHQENTND